MALTMKPCVSLALKYQWCDHHWPTFHCGAVPGMAAISPGAMLCEPEPAGAAAGGGALAAQPDRASANRRTKVKAARMAGRAGPAALGVVGGPRLADREAGSSMIQAGGSAIQ